MGNNFKKEILELKEKIAELRSRFPAHSVKPTMVAQLEELEEQLAKIMEREACDNDDGKENGIYRNGEV